jgi:hypothetical protein
LRFFRSFSTFASNCGKGEIWYDGGPFFDFGGIVFMKTPRCVLSFCVLLVMPLCGTGCAGGYVLTGNVTHSSFPREGLVPAYQKNIRYEAASGGWYNWFPKKNRNPLSREEIVVYGQKQRKPQPYEAA